MSLASRSKSREMPAGPSASRDRGRRAALSLPAGRQKLGLLNVKRIGMQAGCRGMKRICRREGQICRRPSRLFARMDLLGNGYGLLNDRPAAHCCLAAFGPTPDRQVLAAAGLIAAVLQPTSIQAVGRLGCTDDDVDGSQRSVARFDIFAPGPRVFCCSKRTLRSSGSFDRLQDRTT